MRASDGIGNRKSIWLYLDTEAVQAERKVALNTSGCPSARSYKQYVLNDTKRRNAHPNWLAAEDQGQDLNPRAGSTDLYLSDDCVRVRVAAWVKLSPNSDLLSTLRTSHILRQTPLHNIKTEPLNQQFPATRTISILRPVPRNIPHIHVV